MQPRKLAPPDREQLRLRRINWQLELELQSERTSSGALSAALADAQRATARALERESAMAAKLGRCQERCETKLAKQERAHQAELAPHSSRPTLQCAALTEVRLLLSLSLPLPSPTPPHPIPSYPIASHPIPPHPIPRPLLSHPTSSPHPTPATPHFTPTQVAADRQAHGKAVNEQTIEHEAELERRETDTIDRLREQERQLREYQARMFHERNEAAEEVVELADQCEELNVTLERLRSCSKSGLMAQVAEL